MFEAVGYIGSAGAATMWIPQAVRTWRHRRDTVALRGVSFPAYGVALLFNALLLAYGITTDAPPVIIAASVNFACAAFIVGVGSRYAALGAGLTGEEEG